VALPGGFEHMVLSTHGNREGARLDGGLDLGPWEGAVIRAS
jgi:hypothetical protein